MKRSSIAWTDYSGGNANFVIGCTPASTGCRHCYGETWAKRHKWNGGDFGEVKLYPDKLRALRGFDPGPGTYRRPGSKPMCFVVDLGDLFHDDVPTPFIHQALDDLAANTAIDWQILTKRPRRALEAITAWGTLPGNVWIGVTCENQARLVERLPVLRAIPASLRFLSLEPMLEPITIPTFDGLAWAILGAESGAQRRPFDPAWARPVRDACRRAGVSFFYKQGSGAKPGMRPYLDGELVHEWPNTGQAVLEPELEQAALW